MRGQVIGEHDLTSRQQYGQQQDTTPHCLTHANILA
jgi:hypothetical protein